MENERRPYALLSMGLCACLCALLAACAAFGGAGVRAVPVTIDIESSSYNPMALIDGSIICQTLDGGGKTEFYRYYLDSGETVWMGK